MRHPQRSRRPLWPQPRLRRNHLGHRDVEALPCKLQSRVPLCFPTSSTRETASTCNRRAWSKRPSMWPGSDPDGEGRCAARPPHARRAKTGTPRPASHPCSGRRQAGLSQWQLGSDDPRGGRGGPSARQPRPSRGNCPRSPSRPSARGRRPRVPNHRRSPRRRSASSTSSRWRRTALSVGWEEPRSRRCTPAGELGDLRCRGPLSCDGKASQRYVVGLPGGGECVRTARSISNRPSRRSSDSRSAARSRRTCAARRPPARVRGAPAALRRSPARTLSPPWSSGCPSSCP